MLPKLASSAIDETLGFQVLSGMTKAGGNFYISFLCAFASLR
jgi:hypothetical protein